jgi:hypothetical protein
MRRALLQSSTRLLRIGPRERRFTPAVIDEEVAGPAALDNAFSLTNETVALLRVDRPGVARPLVARPDLSEADSRIAMSECTAGSDLRGIQNASNVAA